ncbi:MAG: hypothetical protein KGO98_02060 [Rickettsiales bacterium]|nr:hypothetical protein [Rickettsiales bacterium]
MISKRTILEYFETHQDKPLNIIDSKQWVYFLSEIIIAYNHAKSESEMMHIKELFSALFAGKFASNILFLESVKNELNKTGVSTLEIRSSIQEISEAITYNMAIMFSKKRRLLANKIKINNTIFSNKDILGPPTISAIKNKIRHKLKINQLRISNQIGQIITDYDEIENILKRINIAIGIPSYKEGENIRHPVRKMFLGLIKYFNKEKTVLLGNFYHEVLGNTTNAFENEIQKLITEHKNNNIYTLSMSTGFDEQDNPVNGKGNNLRNFFEVLWLAKSTRSLKGAAVVDADLKTIMYQGKERGITDLWVERLLYPIVYPEKYALKHAAHFVSPLYARHEYDGSLTNNFIVAFYILTSGIFVRQPIGGDFGFSPKALKKFLFEMEWNEETKQYGIDISMSLTVALHKLRIVEAALSDKIHDPSMHKLHHLIPEVFGAVTKLLINNKQTWASIERTRKTKKIGELELPLLRQQTTDYEFYRNMFLRFFEISTQNTNLNNDLLTKDQILISAKALGVQKLLISKIC